MGQEADEVGPPQEQRGKHRRTCSVPSDLFGLSLCQHDHLQAVIWMKRVLQDEGYPATIGRVWSNLFFDLFADHRLSDARAQRSAEFFRALGSMIVQHEIEIRVQ
jgi:hypothetical protein